MKKRKETHKAKRLQKMDEHVTLTLEKAIRPRRVTQVKVSRLPPGMAAARKGKMTAESYEQYLESAHWRSFKALYRASSRHSQECVVCGDGQYELHHRTYERLGSEFFTDVVALCRKHHELAHERVKAGAPLWDAHLPQ